MEWTQEKIYATIGDITARSASDADLRKLALSDPGEAIKSVAGFPLPQGVSIRFVENQGMSYTIGLPKADSNAADGELSDDELESVAGGAGKSQFPGQPGFGLGINPSAPSHPTTTVVAKPGTLPPNLPGRKRY
ncbi:MAG: hypothetical protein JWM80_462 [Cyanobacteria bacterium RYN_339]|nr:hypothetical protein [Cyanobacteria bacterium RYN_339]